MVIVNVGGGVLFASTLSTITKLEMYEHVWAVVGRQEMGTTGC